MTLEYSPIIIPLILSSLILLGLWGFAFDYRREYSARVFLGLITCLLIWSVGFIVEILVVQLSAKILWANIQFIGIVFIPLLILMLSINITGHGSRFIPVLRLLATMAITSILIIWTNDLHHWFRGTPSIDTQTASFPILISDYGFWFYYVQTPIAYLSYILNLGILIRARRLSEKTYRMQSGLLLASMILPLLTDGLYIAGTSPIPHFNFTPVMFSISGLLLGWAVFRYRMLDIGPLAYKMIIQNMQDGLIVLDQKDRIVSLNPAAYQITNTIEEEAIGLPISEVMPWWSILNFEEVNTYVTRLQAPNNNEEEIEEHHEIILSPIFNQNQRKEGSIITLRNVTERVRLLEETKILASTDPLTSVYNRRAFFNQMEEAISNANTSQSALSFMMFDIDNFKEINDQFGHHCGDEMLIKIAQICQENLRKGEIIGRYGGDEFCILLPQTSLAESQYIADRLYQAISELNISPGNGEFKLSISMGVVEYNGTHPTTIEKILQLTDKALYQAKDAGKNQVVALSFNE